MSNLIRYNSLFDTVVDRVFNSDAVFGPLLHSKIDTYVEKDKEYLIEVELPRFAKKEVKVEVQGDEVVISAERKNEYGTSVFQKRYWFENVDVDNISAELKDGLLSVVLPKVAPRQKIVKSVEVK